MSARVRPSGPRAAPAGKLLATSTRRVPKRRQGPTESGLPGPGGLRGGAPGVENVLTGTGELLPPPRGGATDTGVLADPPADLHPAAGSPAPLPQGTLGARRLRVGRDRDASSVSPADRDRDR